MAFCLAFVGKWLKSPGDQLLRKYKGIWDILDQNNSWCPANQEWLIRLWQPVGLQLRIGHESSVDFIILDWRASLSFWCSLSWTELVFPKLSSLLISVVALELTVHKYWIAYFFYSSQVMKTNAIRYFQVILFKLNCNQQKCSKKK